MDNANTGFVNTQTFGYVPSIDFRWLYENTSCPIAKVWALSWMVDPFGNRFVKLPNPNISESAFRKVRRVLKDASLFDFDLQKSKKDPRKTDHWKVQNKHGRRVCKVDNQIDDANKQLDNADFVASDTALYKSDVDLIEADNDLYKSAILPQNHTQKDSPESSERFSKNHEVLDQEKTSRLQTNQIEVLNTNLVESQTKKQPPLNATVAHEMVESNTDTEVQPKDSISDPYKLQETTQTISHGSLYICPVLEALKDEKYRGIPKDLHNQVASNLKLLVQNYSGRELPEIAITELYKQDLELFDEWWINPSVLTTLYSQFVSKYPDNSCRINTYELIVA